MCIQIPNEKGEDEIGAERWAVGVVVEKGLFRIFVQVRNSEEKLDTHELSQKCVPSVSFLLRSGYHDSLGSPGSILLCPAIKYVCCPFGS